MSTFWYTVYTMQDLYGEDYKSFTLFSGTHIFWLVLCVVICAAVAMIYRRASKGMRRKMQLGLAIIIALVELSRQTVIIVTGQWRPETLPLHLCSVNIFISLWYGIHPNKLAGNILYALCLPGAAVALLSPTWCALPINNFCHIDSEMLHILLVCYPVMLLAGGFKPEIKMLPKVLAVLAGMLVVIYPINKLLGTNFFFINDPYGNVITSFCTGIFGEDLFVVGYIVILILLFVLMYTPFTVCEYRHRVKAKRA